MVWIVDRYEHLPLLADAETKTLIAKAQKGDRRAANAVVQHNVRLVAAIATKYARNGDDIEILVAEGLKGMCRAIQKFDVDRGVLFGTYAYLWIKQAIIRHQKEKVVHIPAHLIEKQGQIAKAIEAYQKTHGDRPSFEQLVQVLNKSNPKSNWTVALVRHVASSLQPQISLDAGLQGLEGVSLGDVVAVKDDRLDEISSEMMIEKILAGLSGVDRQIGEQVLSFGFTRREIADQLGCNRCHVDRAIQKIRRRARALFPDLV